MKAPLIERFDLQSPQQRVLYGSLTFAFWVFWFYLWLPVLALLAWGLGVEQAYKYMVVLDGYREVLRLLGVYALIVVLLGGALVLWATYNIVRFRGVESRVAARAITAVDVGRHFAQDPVALERWQHGRRLFVTHAADGSIAHVSILFDGAPVPP